MLFAKRDGWKLIENITVLLSKFITKAASKKLSDGLINENIKWHVQHIHQNLSSAKKNCTEVNDLICVPD